MEYYTGPGEICFCRLSVLYMALTYKLIKKVLFASDLTQWKRRISMRAEHFGDWAYNFCGYGSSSGHGSRFLGWQLPCFSGNALL
jgi:hypothetical protein